MGRVARGLVPAGAGRDQVVETFVTNTIEVQDAVGWEHTHSGQLLLTRGLPQQLKADIDPVRTQHPNIKLGALRH